MRLWWMCPQHSQKCLEIHPNIPLKSSDYLAQRNRRSQHAPPAAGQLCRPAAGNHYIHVFFPLVGTQQSTVSVSTDYCKRDDKRVSCCLWWCKPATSATHWEYHAPSPLQLHWTEAVLAEGWLLHCCAVSDCQSPWEPAGIEKKSLNQRWNKYSYLGFTCLQAGERG